MRGQRGCGRGCCHSEMYPDLNSHGQDLIHAGSRSTVKSQRIHEASQRLDSDIQLQAAMAQLAHEDKMAYTEIFLKVDAESGNGDGALTMDEFEKLLIFCGHRVPKADIAKVFMQMDKDENWKITLDEFLAVLPRLSPPDSADFVAARVRRIFDVYDVNKDGYVTQEEFQIIMSKAGQPLSRNQIHDLIARCDKDGDGKLNFEEFLTIYVAQ